MYELFILGKLMHRPMHGYVLQSIMNSALGPLRRVSWGTLYPLLRKLEENGLITIQRVKASDGRGTKIYRTTALGRTRFLEKIRRPGDRDADYRDMFRVKLSNFGHIGSEDQQFILAEHRAFLDAIATHSVAMSREVLNAPGLADAERPYVLKAIDHQRYLAQSEIAWVDQLARELGGKHEQEIQKSANAGSKRARNRNPAAAARSSGRAR
jgi:DNA-binding PadR family transcriptional regulator